MAKNEYGLANNFVSGYDPNTSLKQYGDMLAGVAPVGELGETVRISGTGVFDSKDPEFIRNTLEMDEFGQATPSAFQGAYTGILRDTGKMGTSMNPEDFQAGSISQAMWADEGGLHLAGSGADTSKDLLGMNPEQWGSALKMGQIGIGAGQLGLGLAGYFENKKTAGKQRELLGQQIESNRSEMDARKNYRSALEGFGSQSQPTRI